MSQAAKSHFFQAVLHRRSVTRTMPIECRPSNVCSDVRCTVCGQGFLLYSDGRTAHDRATVRASVQQELRRQHEYHEHAREGFVLDVEIAAPEVMTR